MSISEEELRKRIAGRLGKTPGSVAPPGPPPITPSNADTDLLERIRARAASTQQTPYLPPSLFASRQQASAGEFEQNLPESTVKSRAREVAIGLLQPFDLHNVPDLV